MEPDEQSYHCGTYRYRPLKISGTRKYKHIIEEPKDNTVGSGVNDNWKKRFFLYGESCFIRVNMALEVSEISKGEQMTE